MLGMFNKVCKKCFAIFVYFVRSHGLTAAEKQIIYAVKTVFWKD